MINIVQISHLTIPGRKTRDIVLFGRWNIQFYRGETNSKKRWMFLMTTFQKAPSPSSSIVGALPSDMPPEIKAEIEKMVGAMFDGEDNKDHEKLHPDEGHSHMKF